MLLIPYFAGGDLVPRIREGGGQLRHVVPLAPVVHLARPPAEADGDGTAGKGGHGGGQDDARDRLDDALLSRPVHGDHSANATGLEPVPAGALPREDMADQGPGELLAGEYDVLMACNDVTLKAGGSS